MKYDAIIIGSGQAGNPLSYRLADLGWQVALIEKGQRRRHVHQYRMHAHEDDGPPGANRALRAECRALGRARRERDAPTFQRSSRRKTTSSRSFRGGIQKKIGLHPNVHFYQGQARFTNAHQVQVGDTLLESDKIFINTGGRPNIPDIPGLDPANVLTNETRWRLTELPEHLIILGGGYIGLEFGQMFRRFGSRVTIIHNQSQIVPREDPEIAAELQKILEAEGIEFHLNVHTTRVEHENGRSQGFRSEPEWPDDDFRDASARRRRAPSKHGRSRSGQSGSRDRQTWLHSSEFPAGDKHPRNLGARRREGRRPRSPIFPSTIFKSSTPI